ncbi:MAG: AprI/Inh family metalloprotease inhibitor [Methylocystis sp.]
MAVTPPSAQGGAFLAYANIWRGLGIAAALIACASATAAETRTSEVVGRYAILRALDKDTGCMLTLEARPAEGGFKAQLAPACRDNGVVIFDPIGWTLEHGRLALTARKGHKTFFDRQSDGVWRRDSKEGKPLSLRRL